MDQASSEDLPEVTIEHSRVRTSGPAKPNSVRQPRAVVKVGARGQEKAVPGWISWTVTNNSFYEADTFRVSFSVTKLPVTNSADWFSKQTEIFVEIFAGFPTNPAAPDVSELTSLIYGRVDEIQYDPVERVINLTGRDLTAAFIDNKVTTQYLQKTSSEIATLLAQSHGLTPVVTATTEKAGIYYKHDQMRLLATRSEWDELAYLGRQEGFVVYVTGHELHFEPDTTDTSDPYLITWTPPTDQFGSPVANVIALDLSRALTVAKGITVTVRSASRTKKTPTVQSFPGPSHSIQPGKASPFGQLQNYYFTLPPGKTPQECVAYAEKRYYEIIAHEMRMSLRLPADNVLQISMPIALSGTGTAFDQTYFARLIEREMSIDEGYEMRVEAQNSSPQLLQAAEQ